LAGLARSEDRFDNGHVFDCPLQGNSLRAVFPDRFRKHIALDGVLISGLKFDRLGIPTVARVINENPARHIRWGIKWDLNFESPFVPES
jgi:hypothetical protein